MKKKLKEFRYRLRAAWRVFRSESMFVVTRRGKQAAAHLHFELDDQVLDIALDKSCEAMANKVFKESLDEGGESVANEAKDILRRASGEA